MPATAYTAPPRPRIARPAAWQFPAPGLLTLDSGLTVWMHDLPGQHAATISCHLRAWADDEPEELAGVSAVMAATLGRGTRQLTASQLAARAAASGMTWSSAAAYTGPVLTCQLPARRLGEGLALLGQALASPAFGEAETGQELRAAIARIAAADADPASHLMRLLPAAIFGSTVPAGRPPGGTAATLARITPADVRACYEARVRPATTTVVIAGDLVGLDPAGLAMSALGGWRDPRPPAIGVPVAPLPRRAPAAILAARPDSAQARLLLAARVPGRDHHAWPALTAAACLLGAPVTGRLDARLRETDGVSYGVTASLTEPIPGSGLFLIGGAIDSGHAIAALCKIIEILEAAHRDGFRSAELATAIEAITRTMPMAYESAAAVAAITTSLSAGGLPLDFPAQVLADVAGLTAAKASDAIHAHLHPDQFTVLVSGDPGTPADQLADLVSPVPLQVV